MSLSRLDSLALLNTAELVQRAKRGRIEQMVRSSGYLLSLPLVIATWIAVFRYCRFGLAAVLLVLLTPFLVPIITISITQVLSDYRRSNYVHELKRRFGRLPFRWYVKHYRKQMEAGKIICIFDAQGLPHGSWYRGYIVFQKEGKAVIETSVGGDFDFQIGQDPSTAIRTVSREVETETAREVRGLAERVEESGVFKVPPAVLDGFPAMLAVLYGNTRRETLIDCNLDGIEDSLKEDPHIRLIKKVSQMVRRETAETA